MSGARAELLTEDDGPPTRDDYAGAASRPAPRETNLPDGLSGGNVEIPQSRRHGDDAGEQFEIVETDSSFRPLHDQPGDDEHRHVRGDVDDGRSGQDEGEGGHEDTRGTRREREDRAVRRQRQREGRDRTQAENAALRAQVADLENRFAGIEPRLSQYDRDRQAQQVASIEQQIQQTTQRAITAKRALADAMMANDPEALNRALDERDQALIQGQQLLTQKTLLEKGHPWANEAGNPGGVPPNQLPPPHVRPNGQPAPPPLTRQAQQYIREFAERHPYFKPDDAGDAKTAAIMALDRQVAAAGFNASTQAYWDELEYRMEEAGILPPPRQQRQRADDLDGRQGTQPAPRRQQQQPPQRRGPMVGPAGEGQGNPRGSNRVMLSPERKEALRQAGAIDSAGNVTDTAKFQRYLKQYKSYDDQYGTAR